MNIREFFRKCQLIAIPALGVYPLVAVALALFATDLLGYAWVFSAVFALLSVIMLALPGKPRVLVGICGILAMILPCVLYLQGSARSVTLPITMIYAAILFWSMFLPGWEPGRELTAGWLSGCFAIGLIGCFFAWIEPRMEPVAWAVRLSFLGSVLLAMLSLNRASLNQASGENRSFPANMRRKNILLTVGMFAFALVIATIPWVYDLLAGLFRWVLQLIFLLQNLLAQPAETTEQTTVPETTENWQDAILDGQKVMQTSEQTLAIMTALVLVVMLPFLLLVLFKLGKLLVKGLRRLAVLLDKAANIQQADYVDEITDTREDTQSRFARKKRRRDSLPHPRNMTPTQRIRYRYQRLLTKHPEWKSQDTARDNLPEEAAKLYERARYSDHPITEVDADRFQNETK